MGAAVLSSVTVSQLLSFEALQEGYKNTHIRLVLVKFVQRAIDRYLLQRHRLWDRYIQSGKPHP